MWEHCIVFYCKFRAYCSNIQMVKSNKSPKLAILVLELIKYVLELALIFNKGNLNFELDYIYD